MDGKLQRSGPVQAEGLSDPLVLTLAHEDAQNQYLVEKVLSV